MSRRPPIIVTAASLEAMQPRRACEDQVAAFRAAFGERVVVPRRASARRALAVRVAAAGLDCGWYAQCVLSPPAQHVYEETVATAERTYLAALATAERAYLAARAPALLDALVADADDREPTCVP